MRKLLYKIPILWKCVGGYFVLISLFGVVIYSLLQRLNTLLATHSQVDIIQLVQSNQTYFIREISIINFLIFIVILFYYWDFRYSVKSLNTVIRDAIVNRRLDKSLEGFMTNKTLSRAINSAQELFILFKSFDNMKTTRISLEVNNINLLINNIEEGIIIVSNEKVVTHINHKGEQLFKLIPGEAVGQVMSRKIIHKKLMDKVDLALTKDEKVTHEPIDLHDDVSIYVSVYPIKNRYGEILRGVIICYESPPAHEGSPKF